MLNLFYCTRGRPDCAHGRSFSLGTRTRRTTAYVIVPDRKSPLQCLNEPYASLSLALNIQPHRRPGQDICYPVFCITLYRFRAHGALAYLLSESTIAMPLRWTRAGRDSALLSTHGDAKEDKGADAASATSSIAGSSRYMFFSQWRSSTKHWMSSSSH